MVAGLFVAVTIAAALFVPFATSVTDNTGAQSVTNESITADVNESVDLSGYDIDSGSETVWWLNSTSGSYEQVTSPDDYSMTYDAGEISFNASGQVDDGDSVKVTYDYQATSGTVTTIAEQLPLFFALLVLGVIAGKLMEMT